MSFLLVGVSVRVTKSRTWHAQTMTDLFDGAALDITCPRCGEAATVTFYGPCEACRMLLRASVGGAARDITVDAYEPKMNVTPNAVASKE